MKKHYRKIVCCLLAAAMMAGLTGCTTYNNFKAAFFPGERAATEPTIKIGIYESMTGLNSVQGKAEALGIECGGETVLVNEPEEPP